MELTAMMIADILGTAGMFYFLKAEVLQLRKILRKKTVKSLSYNTYKSKLKAIFLTMGCFGLTSLWLSFGVLAAELIIVLVIIKLMRKYRGK